MITDWGLWYLKTATHKNEPIFSHNNKQIFKKHSSWNQLHWTYRESQQLPSNCLQVMSPGKRDIPPFKQHICNWMDAPLRFSSDRSIFSENTLIFFLVPILGGCGHSAERHDGNWKSKPVDLHVGEFDLQAEQVLTFKCKYYISSLLLIICRVKLGCFDQWSSAFEGNAYTCQQTASPPLQPSPVWLVITSSRLFSFIREVSGQTQILKVCGQCCSLSLPPKKILIMRRKT